MVPYYVTFSIVLFQVIAAVTTNSNEVCDVVQSHISSPRFRRNTLSPSSRSKICQANNKKKASGKLSSLLAISSILKLQIVYSSETSASIYWIIRCHISKAVLFIPLFLAIFKYYYESIVLRHPRAWLGFYSRTKQEAKGSALFEFRE